MIKNSLIAGCIGSSILMGVNLNVASFYGMIRNIDLKMDQLDQWLEKKKIKDNTLIVFMNDNGGTAGVKTYNAGMKGMKGTNDEGGHRAACFIRYPEGHFGKPRTVEYASEIQDLLPTFIDLFGLKTKAKFDGVSLKPMLTQENKKFGDRMFVVQYGGRIMLTSNNWMGVDVDNRNVVANAAGTPRGGEMKIEVLETGNYLVELSRWPFHLDRKLTSAGPDKTFANTKLVTGRALPIEYGCFSLNNAEALLNKSNSEATKVSFEVKLTIGKNTIQSWFRDANGNELKGAYYMRLNKMVR